MLSTINTRAQRCQSATHLGLRPAGKARLQSTAAHVDDDGLIQHRSGGRCARLGFREVHCGSVLMLALSGEVYQSAAMVGGGPNFAAREY